MTGTDGLDVAPNLAGEPPRRWRHRLDRRQPQDYDRAHALDVPQLFAFLHATQPDTFTKLGLAARGDATTSTA